MATTKATTLAHTLGGIAGSIETAEINRLDGVNADIQTQLDNLNTAKAPKASPQFTGTMTGTGAEGASASLYLVADEGDDNGDGWRINSNQDVNDLTISNNTSGSYVDKLTLDSSGNLGITGAFSGTIGGTTVYPSNFIRQTAVNQGNSQKHNASTTNATAVISQAITSGSQNSKILITFTARVYTGSANTELQIRFGTSNLAADIDSRYTLWNTGGAIAETVCGQVLYDIPQSTTKGIYISILSSNGNDVYVNVNGSPDGHYVLTLQEIID